VSRRAPRNGRAWRIAGTVPAVPAASSNVGIVRLRYQTARTRGRAPLALVGKGNCFDTGGVNLQSLRHMFGMR
jgi:leucyl aminopeptidase